MSDSDLTLEKTIKVLSDKINNMVKTIGEIDPNDINVLCRAFRQVGTISDALTGLLKIVDSQHEELSSNTLPNALEHIGADSIKLSGYNFILSNKFRANINEDQEQVGFKWLRDIGLGQIIKEKVNSNTLSAAVKAYIEEKAMMPPEDVVKIYTKRYIQVRKG